MPKTQINYSNTQIYKLIHNDDINNENIYIGSTTNFVKRKNNHKRNCTNEKSKKHHFKVYQMIRSNGDWEEWSMLLVEKFKCIDKNESLVRERFWIDHFKSQLNSDIPCRTPKEYYQDHKEEISEYNKKYNQDHKEEISIKQNIYNEINKVKIAEQMKKKYENNKQEINEKAKEKIQCECGCFIRKSDIAAHRKTKRHLDLMLTKII